MTDSRVLAVRAKSTFIRFALTLSSKKVALGIVAPAGNVEIGENGTVKDAIAAPTASRCLVKIANDATICGEFDVATRG